MHTSTRMIVFTVRYCCRLFVCVGWRWVQSVSQSVSQSRWRWRIIFCFVSKSFLPCLLFCCFVVWRCPALLDRTALAGSWTPPSGSQRLHIDSWGRRGTKEHELVTVGCASTSDRSRLRKSQAGPLLHLLCMIRSSVPTKLSQRLRQQRYEE